MDYTRIRQGNMPKIETLNLAHYDSATGIFSLSRSEDSSLAHVSLRLEGEYLAVSTSYGPLEIALRPRVEELKRVLRMLQPVDGLQFSRQLGSGQTSIGLGLQSDGRLLIRPAVIGDASGYIAINLALAPEARVALFEWLGV